jgi:uncharacterized protein (TIGR03435 family)
MTRGLLALGAGIALTTVSAMLGLAGASAQSLGEAPNAFEIASVKRSNQASPVSLNVSPGGRFTATGITLRRLIMYAYNVGAPLTSGGDSWVDSERFDIVAKPPEGSIPDSVGRQLQLNGKNGRGLGWMATGDNESAQRLRRMLQTLLADRFQLRLRKETKEMPVYALVVGRNGARVQESKIESSPQVSFVMGQLTFRSTPISFLVTMLTELTGRRVLDETGLKSNYDFKLQWTPDEIQRPGAGAANPATVQPEFPDPSLFTALQEQLGLKLDSTRGAVQILIVDHAERPSEN